MNHTTTHTCDYGTTSVAHSVLKRMWDDAVRQQMTLDESIAERTFERGGRLYLRAA